MCHAKNSKTSVVVQLIYGVADWTHLCNKSIMSGVTQHLERALATALAQYFEAMGEAFPIIPSLDVVDDPDFWAFAEMDCDKFRVRVSAGSFVSTASLWKSVFEDENFASTFEQFANINAADMTHLSLVWLMLHELHHFQMGHFDSLGRSHPFKKLNADCFALVERKKKPSGALFASHETGVTDFRISMELQADHDAVEMLLDAYSADEWTSLRVRIAAISAMMMLIERIEAANLESHKTHPKAATRIFQLLGHVMDMPMYSAHAELGLAREGIPRSKNLPTKEEHERFAMQVVVPAFFDAVSLARVANAQSIADDLGSATEFFQDVQTAKLIKDAGQSSFATVGARQWAELVKSKS